MFITQESLCADLQHLSWEIFLTNQPALEWRGLDWVSRYWSPLPNFVPTEHLKGELLHWHCFKRGLGGKKARVAFHCKPPLNLVFLHWMEFTLKVWNFKPLVLCHLLDCYIGLITLAWVLCPIWQIFIPKNLFQKGEHIWNMFQAPEANCKHVVPTELLAGEKVHWPSYKQGLGIKMARLLFVSYHHWGWCSFTEWRILCK